MLWGGTVFNMFLCGSVHNDMLILFSVWQLENDEMALRQALSLPDLGL